jgi:hypothetical protein
VKQNSSSSLFSQQQNIGKLEKCTHCGINICNKCLLQNHESHHSHGASNHHNNNSNELGDLARTTSPLSNQSQSHYNTVKKEFKQMYNFSKEIVEKLHLLNNAIKIEESAISELNLIKHKVNTKALELIKQINQEKADLIEQIENVKRKYES